VRVERVDVGQQVAHGGRHPLAQVLGRETVEVPKIKLNKDLLNLT